MLKKVLSLKRLLRDPLEATVTTLLPNPQCSSCQGPSPNTFPQPQAKGIMMPPCFLEPTHSKMPWSDNPPYKLT